MRTPPISTPSSRLPAPRRARTLRSLAPRPAAVLLSLGLGLTPLVAHAETRDPGEIGHAVVFFGLFLLLFLTSLGLAIWLVIARLRGAGAPSSEPAGPTPDLDRLWFPSKPGRRPRP